MDTQRYNSPHLAHTLLYEMIQRQEAGISSINCYQKILCCQFLDDRIYTSYLLI